MRLIFTKYTHKPSSLRCVRADGTETWTRLNPSMEDHDLAHYSVEVEMGLRQAFYGMIADGASISEFDVPRERRPEELLPHNLPLESLQTEYLVNQLQVELRNGEPLENFLELLRTAMEAGGVDFPAALTEEMLAAIRQNYHRLVRQWQQLSDGEQLELMYGLAGQ